MKEIPTLLMQELENLPRFNSSDFAAIHAAGPAVTSIRINPAKVDPSHGLPAFVLSHETEQQLTVENVPWCPTGFYLSHRPSFTTDPAIHAGAYYVQEASSMFIDHIIRQIYASSQPARTLDLCGAPGGKTTLLAAALPGSFIVSNEVIKSRVSTLAENVAKWGSSNVVVTHNDPRDFRSLPGFFDLMVVDAPCSGSGMFRKDPSAIDEWSNENVDICSLRQQRILTNALPALAENGYLIYSTCSYSPRENEQMCDWMIDQYGLTPVEIQADESWNIVPAVSAKHGAPGYRFYPDKVRGEGFFVACFRQQNPVEVHDYFTTTPPAPTKAEQGLVANWLQNPGDFQLIKAKDLILAVPQQWIYEWAVVQQHLHMRKSGIAVGTIKGKDLVPHHELALSALLSQEVPFRNLDYTDALRYLKRHEIHPPTTTKGWALARYGHLNLGWMKLLGNRVNNYYPTEWRILKP